MTEIQITGVRRTAVGGVEISHKMWFLLPTIYGTGAAPITGLNTILGSYPDGFGSEIVGGITVITFLGVKALDNPASGLAAIKLILQAIYTAIRTKLDSLTLSPYDTLAGLSWDGTNWA